MRRRRVTFFTVLLVILLGGAGCAAMYAPLGQNPGRLEIQAAGKVDKALIKQEVFRQVGSMQDQPTLWNWLGPPTWQVSAFMLGEARAIWPLKPLGGLALPHKGLSAEGTASFEVPSGKHRFRLTWACTVTHFWSEGPSTWQEPVEIYLRQREMTLEVPAGGVLTISPFGGPPAK